MIKSLLNRLSPGILTLVLRGGGVAVLFMFTIVITRNFAPGDYGDYEFARLILLVVGAVSLLGFDVSILYLVGELRAHQQLDSFLTLYKRILFIIVSLSMGLVFLFLFIPQQYVSDLLGQDVRAYDIVFKCFFILVFNVITLFNTEVFRAQEKIMLSELYRNYFKFFSLYLGVVVILFIKTHFDLVDFYLAGFVLLAIISSLQIFIPYKNKISKKAVPDYNSLIKVSYPIALSNIIFYLLLTIDVFLIRYFYDSESVAFYAVAIKIVLLLNMVNLSFNTSNASKIAELYTADKLNELQKLINKNTQQVFFINLIAGIVILIFSSTILKIFGEEYIFSKSTLIILIISQVLISSMSYAQIYLNMTRKQNIFKIIMFFTLFSNFGLNYILIPIYGIIGAAISYAATIILWHILSVIVVYKKDKVKLFIH